MNLRNYLASMLFATTLCWLAFWFVLVTINPEITNFVGFFLFYFSLFLSLVGTAAIVGFIIRFVGLKQELAFHSVREAFRQSFLFAALILISLFLLSHNLFSWLNMILLIFCLTIAEFFLLSYQKS